MMVALKAIYLTYGMAKSDILSMTKATRCSTMEICIKSTQLYSTYQQKYKYISFKYH